MENVIGPQQRQELFNIGKEFAFEGLDMRYFNYNNADELRIFKEGYQEGLKIMSQTNAPQPEIKDTKKTM